MSISSPTPSPPFLNSRIGDFSPSPFSFYSIHPVLHTLLILLLHSFSVFDVSTGSSSIPYAERCNAVIPESPPTDTDVSTIAEFRWFQEAYFEGGRQIFRDAPKPSSDSYRGSVHFLPRKVHRTLANSVLKVQGELTLQNRKRSASPWNSIPGRGLRNLNGPRGFPGRSDAAVFFLEGFWSSASRKLCMVGSGSISFQSGQVRLFRGVLMLTYLNSSSLTAGLVSGTLDSLDVVGGLNHFDPVLIFGVSLSSHDYTSIEKENANNGFSAYNGCENASLPVGISSSLCSPQFRLSYFSLEYEEHCSTVNCNPLGGNSVNLPRFLFFDKINCLGKERAQAILRFSNSSYNMHGLPFDPTATLVAQGIWDEKKKRACFIGCRFINYSGLGTTASLGDCSIKLCLRFPATLSIKSSSMAVGQIWSNKTMDDTGYFGKIKFQSFGRTMLHLPGLKYMYTKIDEARTSCVTEKTSVRMGMTYPDGNSQDMRFDFSVRDRKVQIASGQVFPVTVGDKFYDRRYIGPPLRPVKPFPVNMSYKISIAASPSFKLGSEISSTRYLDIFSEGTYDKKSGLLCMIGCRKLHAFSKRTTNESVDCGIHVRIQYPPLNANDRMSVMGMIQSTRRKPDPLYFDHLDLSSNSIYIQHAAESIRRMDLEIIMVIVSNSLACVCVVLQLIYARKHPDVTPFTSITMLVVLTLAQLFPLVLNFEALFLVDHNHKKNTFLNSNGWLEMKEVIVRVVTMVAFLLEFRLLQLTWTSRGADESLGGLWVPEKMVLYSSLPLYIGGGMVAWFVSQSKRPHLSPFLQRYGSYKQNYLWGALRSYASLVLDGFLLPQIIFNLFSNSNRKALDPSFYGGTTAVHLLPRAYELYRAHNSPWSFGLTLIYANPKMELHTTAWNVMILCFSLLLVGIVYLQQAFCGRCIIPKRLREFTMYDKVPEGGGE